MSRYPFYPRGGGGKGTFQGRVIRTPAAGSRRLLLGVDFVFSKLRAVDEIVGKFIYRVFAHLGHAPRFLVQSINKRGRGPLPYVLNLKEWNLPLQPAPIVHNAPDHTGVLLMDIEAQIINITEEHMMILRRMDIPHRIIRKSSPTFVFRERCRLWIFSTYAI